ncbi:MAG: heavy-metal-associated domain-containing protein [Methylococcales symbiont of Iophon sp. n. MRB-2018]|nr:MAG: heavy-metal-associated domain-containing protein [Methylococcales symbiont of Iophon sp. n. MRB-2018]KAF3980454.1 MAG: heavy-metal-associated domain-containing protein [Methylococcales symbiont of Iophon sp. n. MRB-2018]
MAESISLAVTGLKCAGCESNVSTQLNNIEGVITVNASTKESKVEVTFDSSKTNSAAISQAISDAGYVVD